ncbi:L-serine ammonia-lyase, iron-sulfur-dependent, subunit alpha [Schumannella sp. 10F1B-5-1]|uniref:L-serine ammonia-lyase, iron-sulfur-dependent, subunit alpha n=1 Tax=Schumannella sp. 10F1B-5-1 TaxID=2590780 RepID=UPI001131B838|nr:L-serine ammonia-lyase, iron-sulfur-dependent, subunit alpha [Schumannella sp. 10F1B-5-1]TPW71558.1 L-serine ammonia-lyase [Schumannella sp. 10F1B-5-1]
MTASTASTAPVAPPVSTPAAPPAPPVHAPRPPRSPDGAYVSALELFSIGIGPSSSHTVGPMRAARDAIEQLRADGRLAGVAHVTVELFGSLGATGIGHGTPDAVVAGLAGAEPETVDPAVVRDAWGSWTDGATLLLGGAHPVPFSRGDIVFRPFTRLPAHPNALTVVAVDAAGDELLRRTYYSVGGGFIRRDDAADADHAAAVPAPESAPSASAAIPATDTADAADTGDAPTALPPARFATADDLLALCAATGESIAEVARRAELERRTAGELDAGLDAIWTAMSDCIDAGLQSGGELPGGLRVRRRAAAIRAQLEAEPATALPGDWLGIYALAVNEQNAAGGRVVTAPTNGAAGILPAVARYWVDFLCAARAADGMTSDDDLADQADQADQPDPAADARSGIHDFLLTATALGSLFRANASISGAEGGCQAEVGSASAMAAGGLTAVLGGTPAQVENAAEIAMEHHLGLTCDPVGGLVQIPCIERNAIAASTAVTAARLALRGDGVHHVSLDTVVETMRQTGADMSTKYKETSEGGLAVNVVEC